MFEEDIFGGMTVSISDRQGLGNIRPDDAQFAAKVDRLKKERGIKGEIVAQHLGHADGFTDAILNPESLVCDPSGAIFRTYLPDGEIARTDGLILPGRNSDLLPISDTQKATARKVYDQLEAAQVYVADSPVIVIEDIKQRVRLVLHSGLNVLFGKPDENGEGFAKSGLIKAIEHIQDVYKINPDELRMYVGPGASKESFGYNNPTGPIAKQLDGLEQLQKELGGKPIITRGGIEKGKRKGGDSVDMQRLAEALALKMGVRKENIKTRPDFDTADKPNEYFSHTQRENPDSKDRGAFTVELNNKRENWLTRGIKAPFRWARKLWRKFRNKNS